jgi:uncharacterized membrane protein
MIQRIQTVFLLLVIISGILAFFFNVAVYFPEAGYFRFYLYGITDLSRDPFADDGLNQQAFEAWYTLPLVLLQGIIIILAAWNIFNYKKRLLQIKINRLNVFLNVILVGALFFYATMIESKVNAKPDYGIAVIFPLISIILLFLANRHIKKDERLVRSADRLR